jgi:hypothetical protein
MLLASLTIPIEDFESGTGWTIKTQGACKGDVCIPLPASSTSNGSIDVALVADAMQLPIAHEPSKNLWAIGPEAIGGKALLTAEAPALVLPDLSGNMFELASLKGKKVLIYAWAPY